jgi:hypothetical protein
MFHVKHWNLFKQDAAAPYLFNRSRISLPALK